MQTCIGVDVGRSSTKIVASWGDGERKELLFPSSVVDAFAISDEREAARAREETVLVNNKAYFFGKVAQLQGRLETTSGLTEDWVFSDQHSALFLGGLKKLADAGVPGVDKAIIVVGLPAAFYASQKVALSNTLSQLAPGAEIRVLSQSMGPYHQMIFTTDGREDTSVDPDQDSWAVVEVGQFTSDYAMVVKGHPIEHAFGSCDGMRIAAEELQRILQKDPRKLHITMVEATEALRTKEVSNFGSKVDVSAAVTECVKPLAAQIINKADQLIGTKARELNGVLIAGGGAPLIFPHLLEKWPHSKLTPNPRYSVADGFCRFAQALALYRASQEASAPVAKSGRGGSKAQAEEA